MNCLKSFSWIVLIIIAVYGCQCSYQYDVIVINETDQPITIKYGIADKSVGKTVEKDTIVPAKQKYFKLLSTPDLTFDDGACTGVSLSHHSAVAEYLNAYQNDSIVSRKNWSAEHIELINTDIQQGELVLRYTDQDF